MAYRSVLTFMDKTAKPEILKDLTDSARQQDFHLSVMVLGAAPATFVYAYGFQHYGGMVVDEQWKDELNAGSKEVYEQVQAVEKVLQQSGISGDVSSAYSERGLIEDDVSKVAFVNDVAILQRNAAFDEDLWARVIAGVLFHSPIGLIIPAKNANPPLVPNRVFAAWNTGLESMRALHQALPLLVGAREVVLGIFDPVMNKDADGEDPGVDVATWLSRHGCNVSVQQYPSGGKEIADCISAKAMEMDAGLVVMGGYGHSRLRQRILGGTTTSMLQQEKLSLFLGH